MLDAKDYRTGDVWNETRAIVTGGLLANLTLLGVPAPLSEVEQAADNFLARGRPTGRIGQVLGPFRWGTDEALTMLLSVDGRIHRAQVDEEVGDEWRHVMHPADYTLDVAVLGGRIAAHLALGFGLGLAAASQRAAQIVDRGRIFGEGQNDLQRDTIRDIVALLNNSLSPAGVERLKVIDGIAEQAEAA